MTIDNVRLRGNVNNLNNEHHSEGITGETKPLNQLCQEACEKFQEKFSSKPIHCAYAPGRVVLSGEHVDYNDGFVLPVAIPLYTVIVGSPNNDSENKCQLASTSIPEGENFVEIDLTSEIKPGQPIWANYIRGVLALYQGHVNAFKAIIHSSLPLGGGLSSSAALEVAMLHFIECIASARPQLSLKEKAVLCEKAEHDYAGVMCGIMDQYISTMARENTAMLIDCRSLESKYIPLDNNDLVLLVCDTTIKHELNGVHAREFSIRHGMCMEAAKLMEKRALRDVTFDELVEKKDVLGETRFKRAKFAVTEICRTKKAAAALLNKNFIEFGLIMNQGHESLRNDYEVSCTELNLLVELVMQCNGVFGTRLTGGGFGGCTVTLIEKNKCAKCVEHVKKNYKGPLQFYVCKPVNGAGTFTLTNDHILSCSSL